MFRMKTLIFIAVGVALQTYMPQIGMSAKSFVDGVLGNISLPLDSEE